MTVTVATQRRAQPESIPYGSSQPASSAPAPLWVELAFNELSEFERVNDHYQAMGIHFSGAIALAPSNPLFSPFPQRLVLAPHAYPHHMTLRFARPPQAIRLLITMAHPIRYHIQCADYHTYTDVTPDLRSAHNPSAQLPTYRLELRQPQMVQLSLDSVAPFIVKQVLWQG